MTDWRQKRPVDMDGAAAVLGISRRTLTDVLKTFPYFEWRGNKKVFYEEHIADLRREMNKCGCKSSGSTAGLMHTAQAPMVAASDALSRLATIAKQKKLARS